MTGKKKERNGKLKQWQGERNNLNWWITLLLLLLLFRMTDITEKERIKEGRN